MIFYGADTSKDRTELGNKSILRIQRGLKYVQDFSDDDYYIYLAAGSHPGHRDKPALKHLYFNYLHSYLLDNGYSIAGDNVYTNGHHNIKLVVIEEYCWGSFEETEIVFQLLKSQGFSRKDIRKHVIAISSTSHEGRIAACWNMLAGCSIMIFSCDTAEKKHNGKLESVKLLETYFFGSVHYLLGRRVYQKASDAKNWLLGNSPWFAKIAS